MDKNNKKIKLNPRRLIFLVIITSIITSLFALSRYQTIIPVADEAKVAVMANNVEKTISGLKGAPGYEAIYPITLVNKDENNNICDVSEKFSIDVESFKNIPLKFSLYKDLACSEILSKNGNGIYENEEFTFKAGKEESKTYYLKVNWPEESDNESYAFEIDCITLNIIATQID